MSACAPLVIPLKPWQKSVDNEEIKSLLRLRTNLWDISKPWVNYVLHGSAAVERQQSIDRQLTEVRDRLLELGYQDRFCRPPDENLQD